jgi:uncharacterized protein YjiS (DUF1127 family)
MFKKFVKYFMAYQQARADYWMLQNMTDTQLKDIGITRGEIRERFYS